MDSGSHVRDDVIELIKDTYGHDNVLPIATYTTEGNANTVLSVCRGLGLDNNIANTIRSKLTDEDLYVQFFGDKKKGKSPNKSFIEEVEKVKEHDLQKYFLAINGLISGRSQHASGVVIYNNGYLKDNVAMMKTKKGHEVTCFNDKEVEFLGGLKIDILSTDALTRMMKTMDLLVEHKEIDWQGDLRTTYDKYLHPDVIDYTNQDMYDLLYSGEIISLFQFSTNVGSEAIRKVNARDFGDIRVANSLMRLSVPDREQPIDKYIRFGKNPMLWKQEMKDNNLTDEEIELLDKYLLEKNGICDTQELLMQLSMVVGGYTLTEANKLRKLVANADKKALEIEYERFKEKGLKHGSSNNLLDYVWKYGFEHQFGYAFSDPHITSYSLIALQEMNLAYFYTPLFWQTACLIVDSGSLSDNTAINYGAIARAVNQLQDKVIAPDINQSDLTFTPNKDINKIMFGIQPIRGLTKDSISSIIEYRPFKSFDDYYERMVETGIITPLQTVILIKAGSFNLLDKRTSRELMIDFVDAIVGDKDKLTMTQFPKLYENKVLDQNQYKPYYELYNFRKKLRSKKKKQKEFYDFFLDNYQNINYKDNYDGTLDIDRNDFEKFYDSKMDIIRDAINSEDILKKYNQLEKQKYWIDRCLGTKESWEIETISFYPDEHQMDKMNLSAYFPISNFNEIQDKNGIIAGTVIDKDQPKKIIYLSTQYGVVPVKLWNNVYNKYSQDITNNKSGKNKIIYDNSWFDVGTNLICIGYRKGEQFYLSRRYTNYKYPLYKITNVRRDGSITFIGERMGLND